MRTVARFFERYVSGAAREQAPIPSVPFHVTRLPNGDAWTLFYRIPSGYLLRFPGLADFEVSTDGETVNSWPVPGSTEATVEHLYLNQVMPLALSRAGAFVLHASAVEVDGGAIAFMGETGRGKSTLAAAFATSGRRFLTDDGLVLSAGRDGVLVHPCQPSIRLWQDSHDHVISNEEVATGEGLSYTPKVRLIAGPQLSFCPDNRPLRAVYFLGMGSAREIEFERCAPARSLIALAEHAFLLDVEDRDLLAAHFNRVADLAERVPSFALDYPRDFQALPKVMAKIVAHASML